MLAHNLLERTRELLRSRPINLTYEKIACDLSTKELKISARWVEHMASTLDANPRFKQLLKLYDYLSAKIAELAE